MTLKDTRILVIGGGSGIGLGVARGAAKEGAKVMIASRDADKLAKAAQPIGAAHATINVNDEAGVAAFFKQHGAFDHIAFTAGEWEGLLPGPIADLDLAKAGERYLKRLLGPIAVAKHGATLIPAGGSYTITNGMLAHRPVRGMPTVTASAQAIEGLTIGLAVDLAPVRVNCVCPGVIETPLWDNFPQAYREMMHARAKAQLVPRVGQIDETGETYLTCMRNSYMTGQILKVEGGIALVNN
jgi:NAD(P)-dependent dehydrogenase (short-subunit alcohol dehydrogenase family)